MNAHTSSSPTPADRPMVAGYDRSLVERNLVELFADRVTAHADDIAVIGPDATLTYAQLAERAMRISGWLRSWGLPPEEAVGVFMRRTADVVAVLLGIVHAGGCYVPLDPAEPAERARFLARGARLPLVLGDAEMLASLQAAIDAEHRHPEPSDDDGDGRAIRLVDVAPILASSAGDPTDHIERCAPGGSRLAYVMYTSGSTGRPKGVEVEHRNVINLLLAAAQAFEFTSADRYLAVSTLAFDISVVEVFLPLISGGSLVLGDRNLLLEPGATAAAIEHHGVTVFQTGPSVWALLLEGGRAFPRLRVAITTGEATAPVLARRIATVADMVWNLYGPTETTIWCSGQRIDTPTGLDHCTDVAVPVGHMWPDMPGIIVDDRGEPVEDGEVGDLWVGGLAVTRGYRHDPVRTAERYVTRPGDAERYYRTGDVISRAPNGVLRFHGRDDDQIQVHGVRVEPMEIESTLRRDPAVLHAAATWFENEQGARSIVAGVVVRPDGPATPAELRARLATQLPAAMVPARVITYDALPLTPNGKTDRLAIRADALRQLVDSPAEPGDIAAASVLDDLTPTERRIHDVWRAVLRVPIVRRDDSFFFLGGDSLATVAMVLDINDAFGISLPVRAAMEHPTLRELAAHIDRLAAGAGPATGDQRHVFRLVGNGRDTPMFFCAIELQLGEAGAWRLDCPLYAVNYWTLGSGFSRARTVEELAAVHVSEIVEIQPAGPYRIAGFSFGGVIALEIAHQLRAAGHEIELLFLLDPTEPYRTAAAPAVVRIDNVDRGRAATRATRERLHRRVARHVRGMATRPSDALPYVRDKARLAPAALLAHTELWPWMQYRMVDLHGRRPSALTARLLPEDRWIAFWYVAKRLARRYVARPFDGPTLAVFLRQTARKDAWSALLGPAADVHEIDTSHADLVREPALTYWSDLLAQQLPASAPSPAHVADRGRR